MPVDHADRRLRVPGAQRVQDLLVLGEGLGDPVGVGVHDGDAHAQLPVAELVVEAGEDLVAAAADDLGVEAAVGDRGGGEVAGGGLLLLPGEQLLQPLHQPRRRGHGLARGVLLDQQPGLHHVGDLLRGDGQHQGALLRVEPDQALDLQPQQRLAHRCAGDADRLRQLPLGEQGPALVAALQDGLLDVGVDAVGRRGPLHCRGHADRIDTTGTQGGRRPPCGRRPPFGGPGGPTPPQGNHPCYSQVAQMRPFPHRPQLGRVSGESGISPQSG